MARFAEPRLWEEGARREGDDNIKQAEALKMVVSP
jgi:hypothetical protein